MPTTWQEPAPPLGDRDPAELAAAARAAVEGVTFGSLGDERFNLDPVPRVIEAAEWEVLAAGLAQRVRALDAWCADVYGARRIVADGVVPARVIETTETYEPALAGVELPLWVGIAGLDVVRGADGRFRVLEDNLRTPSGMAYAVAARETTLRLLEPASPPRPLDDLPALVRGVLAAAAGRDAPRAAVLTDGPDNAAHWEHAWVARALGVPLLEPDELDLDAVDVIYRRTNADRVDTPVGRQLCGRVALVNAFGVGVGDDKLAHAYVEDMVRYYLGEEPLVPSVRTYDLSVPAVREEALDRLDELVVKPRDGFGGEGVVICPHAEPADVDRIRRAVAAEPGDYIAQELVTLSCHPTIVDGELVPRHVDLRPFVFLAGGEAQVLPGGLTRVALDEGALVVNSSQNGGAKDTWVV
ncbi:MAG TPA: circularly permuted type 2 ATP-grasp protein [Solirubrobacteraceae bacterium]|nr:circularly permuted type 2 ATP-grasp protein [Solirubrobacteraceae bacterium]